MLTSLEGVIKDNHIIIENEDIQQFDGKHVIITILDAGYRKENEDDYLQLLENNSLVISTELGNQADAYIEELRADERI